MARRLAAALVLVALGGVTATIFLQAESDPLSSISNRGRPGGTAGFHPNGGAPNGPQSPLMTGAFLVARRGEYEFFRMSRDDGSSCWGTTRGYPEGGGISALSCGRDTGFPSRKRPLTDFSTLEQSDERRPRFLRLVGFAADGVAQIAVIDPDNRVVPAVPVKDNVYFTEQLPSGDFYGLAALDADGAVVWRTSPVG